MHCNDALSDCNMNVCVHICTCMYMYVHVCTCIHCQVDVQIMYIVSSKMICALQLILYDC